jgi:hypothetical protein
MSAFANNFIVIAQQWGDKQMRVKEIRNCITCSYRTVHSLTMTIVPSTIGIWHSEDRASWYILITKTNTVHYFSTLFWYRTLHVLDRSTVHHQEFNTVFTGISICHTEILKMGKITASVWTVQCG